MKHSSLLPLFIISLLGTVFSVVTSSAADPEIPASPEVTAAMQPYLDSYKIAGIIGIIADKEGRVHYKNLLGYADVEAKKPISEDNVFWIASMSKMKTVADWIQVKLREKGMAPYHLAFKMGIAASVVNAWKDAATRPQNRQMREMVTILGTYRHGRSDVIAVDFS